MLVPRTTVSISQRIGQPTAASVTPSSARSARWPCGRAAAVAPHRRDDEGAKPRPRERLDRRAGDPVDAGDPPAADRQRDRAAGRGPARRSGWPGSPRRPPTGRRPPRAGRNVWRTRAIGGSGGLIGAGSFRGGSSAIGRRGERSIVTKTPARQRPSLQARGVGRSGMVWITRRVESRVGRSLRSRCSGVGHLVAPASFQATGVRLLRTRRTRATAPAIPAQARIVAGSGTGDGEITVPFGGVHRRQGAGLGRGAGAR